MCTARDSACTFPPAVEAAEAAEEVEVFFLLIEANNLTGEATTGFFVVDDLAAFVVFELAAFLVTDGVGVFFEIGASFVDVAAFFAFFVANDVAEDFLDAFVAGIATAWREGARVASDPWQSVVGARGVEGAFAARTLLWRWWRWSWRGNG